MEWGRAETAFGRVSCCQKSCRNLAKIPKNSTFVLPIGSYAGRLGNGKEVKSVLVSGIDETAVEPKTQSVSVKRKHIYRHSGRPAAAQHQQPAGSMSAETGRGSYSVSGVREYPKISWTQPFFNLIKNDYCHDYHAD